VQTPLPGGRIKSLPVELRVDHIRSRRAGMELAPDRHQPQVVLAAAQRAWAVTGGKSGPLVEEEQLGEHPGLHQWGAMPPPEPQTASDPAPAGEQPADAASFVVQAASV